MKKLVCASIALMAMAGCRQDMHNQPKYIPLRESEFFRDGRSARLPVQGTVARGELREDTYFYTGKINGQFGAELPMPLTKELLARGQNRYNIYCTPCHSRVGDGNGMIPSRAPNTGSTSKFKPPSYHEERLKKQPIGYFYDVMTNGFGVMLNYSAQIKPEDRWAIAAYIRALQLSQDASINDVPAEERGKIAPVGEMHGEAAPANDMSSPNTGNTEHHAPGQPNMAAPSKSAPPAKKGGTR
jgi:mono/diheme cytochrome c family protein